jgi:cytoskeletal protein RodZ
MSKYLLVLVICLLASMFALAQATQPSQAPAQQPPQSQDQAQQPSQTQPPPSGDRSQQTSPDRGQQPSSDRSNASSSSSQTTTSDQPNQQPTQPNPRRDGGVGWGWIIVAIVIGVIVIGMLSRGRSERVEHIDRTERDHDDIRRAG